MMVEMDWSLYIHIPFCRKKCLYCDFPSQEGKESLMVPYAEALCREIKALAQGFRQGDGKGGSHFSHYDGESGFFTFEPGISEAPSTVYIGGGTPTALPTESIVNILGSLDEFPMKGDREITVEANPGTVDIQYLDALIEAGANRISIGVQSFSDRLLSRIGRIHSGIQAKEAVILAKKAGFSNISIDLMYGLPGQTLRDLEESLKQAVELNPTHISVYGLQIEEGTPFFRLNEEGKLSLPSEETAEEMYDYIMEFLPKKGYLRYEISNFSLPGMESRHNSGYWQDRPYIGIGAAAHSYWRGERFENIHDAKSYIDALDKGLLTAQREGGRTLRISMAEFCFLSLRTTRGIPKQGFSEKFGRDIGSVYGNQIDKLKRKGLLYEDMDFLRLTKLGMKYGNLAFEEFL